jgi:hypothetical protein
MYIKYTDVMYNAVIFWNNLYLISSCYFQSALECLQSLGLVATCKIEMSKFTQIRNYNLMLIDWYTEWNL